MVCCRRSSDDLGCVVEWYYPREWVLCSSIPLGVSRVSSKRVFFCLLSGFCWVFLFVFFRLGLCEWLYAGLLFSMIFFVCHAILQVLLVSLIPYESKFYDSVCRLVVRLPWVAFLWFSLTF